MSLGVLRYEIKAFLLLLDRLPTPSVDSANWKNPGFIIFSVAESLFSDVSVYGCVATLLSINRVLLPDPAKTQRRKPFNSVSDVSPRCTQFPPNFAPVIIGTFQ